MITIPQLDTPIQHIIDYDQELGIHLASCKEFPQVLAEGTTQEEAERNLAGVLEIMLSERGDDLFLQLDEGKVE